MPHVAIKGVGSAQFPDDMGVDQIRGVLRSKFPPNQFPGLTSPSLAGGAQPSIDDPFIRDAIQMRERRQEEAQGRAVFDQPEPGLGQVVIPGIEDTPADIAFTANAIKEGDLLGSAIGAAGTLIPGLSAAKLGAVLPLFKKAQKEGFDIDTTLFHGSTVPFAGTKSAEIAAKHGVPVEQSIKRTRGGIFLSEEPSLSQNFVGGIVDEPDEFIIRKGKVFDAQWNNMDTEQKGFLERIVNDSFDEEDIADIQEKLADPDWNPFDSFTDGELWQDAGRDKQNDIHEALFKNGFDTLVVPDAISPGAGGISTVVNSPDQIRPKFALQQPAKAPSTARELQKTIEASNPGLKLSLGGGKDFTTLSKIIVPKEQRNLGTGSKVMKDIVKWADGAGETVALTPSSDFGGSKAKLVQFYKRFGFVENKGRNKDFEISETMFRLPQQ